jgi:methylmalonyl-CoA/ethylmalonyl-CoA epimerase
MKPGGEPHAGLSVWIDALAGTDAVRRAAAAGELYRTGCAQAQAATIAWQADAEFSALLAGAPVVGIAVPPELFARIHRAAGAPPLAKVPAEQSTAEFELHLGEAQLDILTPVGGAGAIARFLERFGPGIQQVEFPVKEVDRAVELLVGRFGLKPVYPKARPGANCTRVNFFLASLADGRKTLIELFEEKR